MTFRLNRRAFLRSLTGGAAASLALPALEAMIDSKGRFYRVANAANVAPPVRYFGYMINNGAPPQIWAPIRAANGTYSLNVGFGPLAHLKDDLNQITNTDFRVLRNSANAMIEHANGQRGFWTGYKTDDWGAGQGPSIEYLLGKALGEGVTKFNCLTASLPRGWSDRMDETGRNTWAGKNQPGGPYLYSPKQLADKLLTGLTTQQDNPDDRRKKNILDQYMVDTKALQAKLGLQDRARLDQHLTTVEEIQQQLTVVSNLCGPDKLQGSYVDSGFGGGTGVTQKALTEAVMPVMKDLILLAFQCDLTRYVLFEVANSTPKNPKSPAPEESGQDASMSDHFWSHLYSDQNNALTGYNGYYLTQKLTYWATFLDAMKASVEGDKSILYNSVCLLGSDIAQGTTHQLFDHPIVTVGQAGGRLKTGQIMVLSPQPLQAGLNGASSDVSGQSVNRVHAALLTAAGLPTAQFGGDNATPLPGLLV